MRLYISFNLCKHELPKDYRKGFISLIKLILDKDNPLLFRYYYSEKKPKSFTFNVYFPQGVKESTPNDFEVGNKAILQVSSNDIDFITAINNGCHKIKDFQLFYNQITFDKALLIPLKRIHSEKVQLKTVSPFLINTRNDNSWYLVPGEKGFEKAFDKRFREEISQWLGITEFDYEIIPVNWKRCPITHYNQTMSGVKGEFIIKAPREILQLIYDLGIGVRRSQGFGMLEIVKEF